MFKDFGSIYSTLLPGATAELVPPSGEENCLAGLEFRIAFSGKYKESLTELSGGQRSLVALSLILAMLKFKPAPFYILDEVSYLNSNTVILNIIINVCQQKSSLTYKFKHYKSKRNIILNRHVLCFMRTILTFDNFYIFV